MLRAYVAAGFDPKDFWGLTPRLYLAHMRGARDRLEREHKDRSWLAWHIEALRRQDKLPDLRKFMGGPAAEPRKQSPEVLQAMCEALAVAWGAERQNK